MHLRQTIFAFILLPAAALAQSDPQGPPTPPPTPPAAEGAPAEAARELAAKREELDKITQEIGALQTRAEAVEEVKSSRNQYRNTLQTEMVRSAPALKSEIERQAQLVEELMAAPPEGKEGAASTEQQQQKLTEYRTLHRRLAPVEEGVRDVPAVQNARKQFYDRLVAEMRRIEPRTDDLLAKHRELVAVVRELAVQAQSG